MPGRVVDGNGEITAAFGDPQVLPPQATGLRARVAQGVFSNQNLDRLSHLLDDCFVIPGTQIRFGLDGIIGLVPFAGDVLAGMLSSLIVIAAWFRGAPPVLLGSIPVFGDAFDIAWKANRRNYALLSRFVAEPKRHAWRDWAFLLVLAGCLFAVFALPMVLLGYVLALLIHRA
jgi:hypothetical protein